MRVCPHCGSPPGDGVFCAACGRNLAVVERLPTLEEWERDERERAGGEREQAEADRPGSADPTAAFLAAMRAAGNPGTAKLLKARTRAFGRSGKATGWTVREVDREDFEGPRRYEPGLFLTVDGEFHQLDSELRGWGQRNFPYYHHTISAEPVEPPGEIAADLAAVLAKHGVG